MKKFVKFVFLLMATLMIFSMAACKKGNGESTDETPESYKQINFRGTDVAVDTAIFNPLTDEKLTAGLTAKDGHGKYHNVEVADRTALNVNLAGTYDVTVGAKENGEWIMKSETEKWTAVRRINVRGVSLDGLRPEGFEKFLDIGVGETVKTEKIIDGLSVLNTKTGEYYNLSAESTSHIDTFKVNAVYNVNIAMTDKNGQTVFTADNVKKTFVRQIRTGGLYYLEAAQNNGDTGPWGTNATGVLTAEQIEAVGGNGKLLPIRESNVYFLKGAQTNRYLENYADPLGARLFVNNTDAPVTVSVVGGSGVSVEFDSSGKVIKAYDGLNSRDLNSSNTLLETAPHVAFKPYGMNYSIGAGNIALFKSNQNEFGGASYDSNGNGSQFILKNVCNEYGNFVRIFKGGADGYDGSQVKITDFVPSQAPRIFGNSSKPAINIDDAATRPTAEEAAKYAYGGVYLKVNFTESGSVGQWNDWKNIDITELAVSNPAAVKVTAPGDYDKDMVADYVFTVNIDIEEPAPVNIEFTRTIALTSQYPTLPTIGFFDDTLRFEVPRSGNNILSVNDGGMIVRNGSTGLYKTALYSYEYFWNGEDEGTRISKIYDKTTNPDGNYFSATNYVAATNPTGNLGDGPCAFIVGADGKIRVVYSAIPAMGVWAVDESGAMTKLVAAAGNTVSNHATASVPAQIRPGEYAIIMVSGGLLRNWTDGNSMQINPQRKDMWRTEAGIKGSLGSTVKLWHIDTSIIVKD